jgi:hypothetical protein
MGKNKNKGGAGYHPQHNKPSFIGKQSKHLSFGGGDPNKRFKKDDGKETVS